MIRRRGAPSKSVDDASSSDDDGEEDAFAALSSRASKRQKKDADDSLKARQSELPKEKSGHQPGVLPVSLTSSMKRHHKPSEDRKAKMDALLQELEEEKKRAPPERVNKFIPEKKGSFVDASEEHLTTNIFVVSAARGDCQVTGVNQRKTQGMLISFDFRTTTRTRISIFAPSRICPWNMKGKFGPGNY